MISAKLLTTASRFDIPNSLQWRLDDNAPSRVVAGSVQGTLVGGNTEDVYTVIDGKPAFHLDGSSQYVQIPVPSVWPNARRLWSKHADNPVIPLPNGNVLFGQLVRNPGGGWYFFTGVTDLDRPAPDYYGVFRWESDDLINWTNRTLALPGGGEGAWDREIQVASVFQKPNGDWILLYRGRDTSYNIGLATSSDGTTFVRKDNGGVDDGLFPQFGGNFDLVGTILVDDTYYVWVNGEGGHGKQYLYKSVDDFQTFTSVGKVFGGVNSAYAVFCSHIWRSGSDYYLLACREDGPDDGWKKNISLYRSTHPEFPPANREYLGCVLNADQSYDNNYLDTPSVPTTDITRTVFAPEFADDLHVIYSSVKTGGTYNFTQSLATTSLSSLPGYLPCLDQLHGRQKLSISFFVQFDTLTQGDVIFSVTRNAADNGLWLCRVMNSGGTPRFSLYNGPTFYSSTVLQTDRLYKVVITDDTENVRAYIDGELELTMPSRDAVYLSNIYLGTGYGVDYLDGYIGDFRIYPKVLTSEEMVKLDLT